MNSRRYSAALGIGLVFAACALCAQARKEVSYDWAPDEAAATVSYTMDDYSLQVSSSGLQRAHLNGVKVEYASRHFYPWEVVGAVQYSSGELLGQSLFSVEAGIGYCRSFRRWTPFARFAGGANRTSSGDLMYLYAGPKWGLVLSPRVGADYQLTHRWGIRVVEVENEYLPYGSLGSIYWSIGSGITYRFHP